MTYEERIPVPVWWWLAGLFLLASLAVAVYAYVEVWLASMVLVVAAIVIAVGLLGYSLRIRVADGVLTVGRNRLEGEYVADAEPLDTMPTGREGQDDFLLTRPFVRQLVRVVLDDPADPHPAWLVSTRRPAELVEAIRSIRKA